MDTTDKVFYNICVGGSTIIGISVGSAVPVIGSIVGGISGFALGVAHCKFTAPALKKKIFSEQKEISDAELEQVLSSIKRSNTSINRNEAMRLFAGLRIEIAQKPWLYRHV